MNQLLANPRAFVLIIALIIVSGLTAISALPRNEDPRIANRHAFVMTEFPGASAERVEALVTEPLESQLREIAEVLHIDSRSSAGFSTLTIELVDSVGIDQTDALWARIRDKLTQASGYLPMGAEEPVLEERRGYPFTLIVALTSGDQQNGEQSDQNLLVLGRYGEELQSRLRGLPGTDFISLHGQPDEEIVVDVDAAKAGLLGLSPRQIGGAVLAADAKVSAGEINNDRVRLAVEVEGALDTLERIRQIPLRQVEKGGTLVLGDLANVHRQARQPARDLALIHGKQAVVLGIRMLPDQRSDLWSDKVRQQLDFFEQQLPTNVSLEILFDQEHYTAHRLEELVNNILLGFILIAIVLLLTLGWRAALIVAAALPLTVLFAFACMNFTGLPIHQMSVTGLIVALGIMVDNAIVMVDTVNRYKQQGLNGLKATQAAVNHLWLPLLGSTLTTVLAFMPIVLMPGSAGEFVGGIGLTVIFSLIGSYLISHLVVAGLAGRLLQSNHVGKWWDEGVQLPRWSKKFRHSIASALQMPIRILLLVTALPIAGFIASSTLPEQFFPPADRDMINLEVYLPASASIQRTAELTEKISSQINQQSGVKSLHWFVGRSVPSYYYNLMQGKDNSHYYAQAMLTVDHFSVVDGLAPLLQKKLDDLFPEAQIVVRRLEQGPPFNAPVELRLTGSNLATLRELGDQLRRQFLAIEDVVHVRSSLSEPVPKVWMAVNENLARSGELSLTDIALQLHDGVDGGLAGSVLEGTQSLPVRVQAHGQRQIDISGVQSWILVPGTENQTLPIPYASLGRVEIRPELGVIPRRDGERVNTLQIYIRDKVLPATVLQRVKASLIQIPALLPAGYSISFAGEDEKRDQAVGKLLGSVGVILVLLIVAVVMSFNSFRLSAMVFFVAMQAAGLGLMALFISGSPFGFTSIIGLMGLIGLAINAAIVILAELKSDPLAIAGDHEAVVNGVMKCSRHISSTTITTVMGFMPLILSGGAFWPPFAFVIAGGTVLATLLSFYFVPVVFLLMSRYRHFELSASSDFAYSGSSIEKPVSGNFG